MALSIERPDNASKRGVPVAFFVMAGIALLVAGAVYYFVRKGPPPVKDPVLTQEARQYVRSGALDLSEVNMAARESFAKSTLVELTGKITNKGDRQVRLVEVTCVFREPNQAVIMRERLPIVGSRTGSLKPGETKAFRLAFDTIPPTWNQVMPELVIAQIQFD